MEVKQIHDDDFDAATAEGTVLVDVFTTWCGPCKMMAPIVAAAAEECPEVKFYKLDAEECPEVSLKYMIRSVPTLLVFKDGDLVDTSIGVISKEELLELVK
ncbi:MAG: thioredoxin [Eubacteriales bacterium]